MKQKFLLFLVVCVASVGSVFAQTTAYSHIVTYKWTGAAGGAAATQWANALNWVTVETGGASTTYDAYPNASATSPRGIHNVWIPSGVSSYPVLSADTRVDNLQLDAGSSINLGGFSLVVNGTVSGTGQLNATNVGANYADVSIQGKPNLSVYKVKSSHDATITAGTIVQNFTLAQQTSINATPVNAFPFPASSGYSFTASTTNAAGTSASGTLAVIRDPLTSGATAQFKLATDNIQDALRLEFTGNSVYAFSADISCTDNFGPVAPPGTDLQGKPTTTGTNTYDSNQDGVGDVSIATNEVILKIELTDGSSHQFTLNASGEYVGVNSNQPITAVMVISGVKDAGGNGFGYATIHNFRMGTRGNAATLNFVQSGVANRLGSLTVNTATASTGIGQVVLGNAVKVTEFVNPVSGTIVSGGNLTLGSSDALGTARVSSHTSAGVISGNANVERFIPGNRKKQWRFLSLPFAGSTLASTLTGINYSLDPTTTVITPTMMTFNESLNDGKYGNNGTKNNGYQSLTTSSETINSGEGFAAWIYNSTSSVTGTLAINESQTLVSQGALSETGADYSKSLSFTAGISLSANRGWNLVGNPFASTIDWGLVTKPADLAGTIYKWDPQGEQWGIYNPATLGTNTMDQYIESGASFFVKAGSASTSLTFPQSAKTAITGSTLSPFSKNLVKMDLAQQSVGTSGTSGVKESFLKLKVQGPGNPEPAFASLGYGFNDATSGFDDKYDAYFRGRYAGAAISIQGENDIEHAVQFDRPIMENGKEKRIYPLIVTVPSSGKVTLNLEGSSNWNSLNRVYLIDKKEGKTIPAVGNTLTYEFEMATTKEADRFLLAINHVKMDENTGAKSIDVRVINNPIQQDVIDALITHPTAKPKAFSVVNGSGATLNRGAISNDNSIQHRLSFGKSNSSGTFYLKVDFENGDSKTVKFIKL